jgi:hypothetical protein
MPKLIEANIFAKLLSAFFNEKSKGKEDELQKKIKSSKSKEAKMAYDAWESESEKLLLATKKMLMKSGLDTSEVDNLLKKYYNY